MNNQIQIFESKDFDNVRAMEIDGQAWFVGKDICNIFGDKNHNRSLSRIDEEDKITHEIIDIMGRKQRIIMVNESGLYSLLFNMQPQKTNNGGGLDAYPIEVHERMKRLHQFKRWVTSEVLPSIRKHGSYITSSTLDEFIANPDMAIELLTSMKKEYDAKTTVNIYENREVII